MSRLVVNARSIQARSRWAETLRTIRETRHLSHEIRRTHEEMELLRNAARSSRTTEAHVGASLGSGIFREKTSWEAAASSGDRVSSSLTFEEKRAAVENLRREFFEVARRFHPTGTPGIVCNFTGLALLDDKPVHIQIQNYNGGGIVRLTVHGEGYMAFFPNPTKPMVEQMSPGTENFALATRALAAIRERLENSSPDTEIEIADHRHILISERNHPLLVPKNKLDPKKYQPNAKLLQELDAKASAIASIKSIELSRFVSAVAALVEKSHTGRNSITTSEKTWEELRDHIGIENREFERLYQPVLGSTEIDLIAAAGSKSKANVYPLPRFSPLKIEPRLDSDGQGVRFVVEGTTHTDKGILTCFEMYKILINRGLPVTFAESFVKVALGEELETLPRNDPRVAQLGIPLPSLISLPLADGEEPSLPEYEVWVRENLKSVTFKK